MSLTIYPFLSDVQSAADEPQESYLLSVIHTDGAPRRRLADAPVLAFFWSPDARKIAYVVPSLSLGQEELLLTWHVVELEGEPSRELTTFKPTACPPWICPKSNRLDT